MDNAASDIHPITTYGNRWNRIGSDESINL
jgi:hypothetical protein